MPNSAEFEDPEAKTEGPVPDSVKPTASDHKEPAPATARAAAEPNRDETITIGGGFRKRKLIGHGGFGEVWSAETQGGGFPVAIKIILKPLDHAEAQRELKSLELIKNLSHPFLLQTREYWSHEGRLYIVMDLAEGSLRDRYRACRQGGQPGLPLAELLAYIREAAEALDYLHSENVHHRDIKPENILLLKGHVKVADFGLASELEKRRLATISGSNTPMYAAPEIDRRKVSPHSDQYSLAMTYAELRLGRPPFEAQSLYELVILKNTEMPDLGELDEQEKQVLFKALAKDPERRYPTCREFVLDLERALASLLAPPAVAVPALPVGDPAQGSTLAVNTANGQRTLLPGEPRPQRARSGSRTDLDPTDPNLPDWRPTQPSAKRWPVGRILFGVALLAVVVAGGYYVATRDKDATVTQRAETTVPDTTKTLTTKKAPPLVTLPRNCEMLPNDRGENIFTDSRSLVRYYQKIAHVLPDSTRIVFRLIPPTEEGPHTAFYLMQDKVTNELFGKFAKANPDAVKNSHWHLGALKGEQDLGNTDPLLPVMRVTAEEAHRFARWLGGSLPTTAQYDRAAGVAAELPNLNPLNKETWEALKFAQKCQAGVRFPRDGFKQWNLLAPDERSTIGVARADQGPMPINEQTLDVSPYGCRHLAGNGREYTNSLWNSTKLLSGVHAKEDLSKAEVELRGKSYRSPVPSFWQFEGERIVDLDRALVRDKPAETSDIGFRVVIHPGSK